MSNILFPSSTPIILEDHIAALSEDFLWRMSEKTATNHFILDESKNEQEISFFASCHDQKELNDGYNFLVFMFCYPLKNPFSNPKKRQELCDKIAIRLNILALKSHLHSTPSLREKIKKLYISRKQRYKDATHWELHFTDNEYCLDPEIQFMLSNISELHPEEQGEHFIQSIFAQCLINLNISPASDDDKNPDSSRTDD